jgi:thiol-disulfide isomerase/thioredoxin
LLALLVLIGSGLVAGCGPERLESGPAPEFEVRDLKTQSTLDKSRLLGHPVVLDFWATWCEPCRELIPDVDALQRDYGSKGVRVIGVSNEDAQTVGDFAKARNLSYTMALDPNSMANRVFGVDAFPTMIVLNAKGEIIYRDTPPDEKAVREALDKALKS